MMLIIIPCGARKLTTPAPACSLYNGPYFRACLKFALRNAPRSFCFILSAKHGLLALDDRVAPYEMRLGGPGCVTAESVRQQAAVRGLLGHTPVLAVGGKPYRDLCRAVWPGCLEPFRDAGGIGKQLRAMKSYVYAN